MSSLPSSLLFAFIIMPLPVVLLISIIMAIRDGNNNMNNKHNAKYAFYYLLSLAALIFMALSVGMIFFSIIDETIPDILAYYNYYAVDSQLKFAISALFISAPIFYFVSSLINRGLHRGELEKDSAIRRWLTYFIILVSSLIILGSFVSLINNFLSGELTVRFILKAIAVLFISGATFSFYFYDAKRENPDKPDKVVKTFLIATVILVAAAFIAAWFFVESPKEARARRLDQIVLDNVSNLENAVNNYYSHNQELPETLDNLKNNQYSSYFNPTAAVDPETKEPLVYNRLSATEFEICATFRTDSRQLDNQMGRQVMYQNKEHDKGYQCLTGNLWEVLKETQAGKVLAEPVTTN